MYKKSYSKKRRPGRRSSRKSFRKSRGQKPLRKVTLPRGGYRL